MDWRIPRGLWRGAASRLSACLDVERDVVKEGGGGGRSFECWFDDVDGHTMKDC